MADSSSSRAAQLSFKKATEGLTEAEEQELQALRQEIALNNGSRK